MNKNGKFDARQPTPQASRPSDRLLQTHAFVGVHLGHLAGWIDAVHKELVETLLETRRPLDVAPADRRHVKAAWIAFAPEHADRVLTRVLDLVKDLIQRFGVADSRASEDAEHSTLRIRTKRAIVALRAAEGHLLAAGYPTYPWPLLPKAYQQLQVLLRKLERWQSEPSDSPRGTERLAYTAGSVAQEFISLGRVDLVGTRPSLDLGLQKVCRDCVGDRGLDTHQLLVPALEASFPTPQIPVSHGGMKVKRALERLGKLLAILKIPPQGGEGRSGTWNATALHRLFERYQQIARECELDQPLPDNDSPRRR